VEASICKIAVIITITTLIQTKVVPKKTKLKITAIIIIIMRRAVKVEAQSLLEALMELSGRYENYRKRRSKRS